MLILWNGTGPLSIGHPNEELAKGGKNPDRKINTQLTLCVPGLNHLDDKFLEQMKTNPGLKSLVDSKGLEIVTEKDAPPKEGVASVLGGLTGKAAVAAVGRCLNKPLLEQILVEDSRPDVQFAARAQLDELKLPAKKEK